MSTATPASPARSTSTPPRATTRRRPNAPVTVYASGIRNGYDLVWHSNGQFYVAGNESASGNTPAGPDNIPPALTNLPAYTDYLARIVAGGYYGHPNPTRRQYVLNGGNPTAGVDPFQVTQYPVGTTPDPDWSASRFFDMGLNRSPNGLAEYTSNAFGGALRGRLIGVEFSAGDDVYAATAERGGHRHRHRPADQQPLQPAGRRGRRPDREPRRHRVRQRKHRDRRPARSFRGAPGRRAAVTCGTVSQEVVVSVSRSSHVGWFTLYVGPIGVGPQRILDADGLHRRVATPIRMEAERNEASRPSRGGRYMNAITRRLQHLRQALSRIARNARSAASSSRNWPASAARPSAWRSKPSSAVTIPTRSGTSSRSWIDRLPDRSTGSPVVHRQGAATGVIRCRVARRSRRRCRRWCTRSARRRVPRWRPPA